MASSAVSLWALVGAFGALFFYSARDGDPVVRRRSRADGRVGPCSNRSSRANPAPIPVAGPDRLLRPQHLRRGADRVPPPAVRRSRPGRGAGELRAAAPEHPPEVDRRAPQARGGPASPRPTTTSRSCSPTSSTSRRSSSGPSRRASSAVLDEIFSAFDRLAERHGLEKIKTIGDAYMVVAGLPEPRADHVEAMAEMALEMQADLVAPVRAARTRPRDPDRDGQRTGHRRRHRPAQVHLRPVGRHGQHGEPDGVVGPAGSDPGHGGRPTNGSAIGIGSRSAARSRSRARAG